MKYFQKEEVKEVRFDEKNHIRRIGIDSMIFDLYNKKVREMED